MTGRSDTRALTKDEREQLHECAELVAEAKATRNDLILRLYRDGVALRPLGEALEMSKSRVHQIVQDSREARA